MGAPEDGGRTTHRSLRRRVAVSFGIVFVLGAILFRLANYQASVDALERDVDLGLRGLLAAIRIHDRHTPANDADDALLTLPDLVVTEDDRHGWIGRFLDLGHDPVDLARFRWFAGGWRRDGTIVHDVDLPAGFAWDPAWATRTGTVWNSADGAWRLAAVEGSEGTVLLAGTDRASLAAAARREAIYQATTFAVWVPFVLGLAWVVLSRVLAPLAEIAATAHRIRRGAFGERIDLDRADAEIAEVAGTINGMLDRLDDIRLAQTRFNADVAHQIVNPVHAILLETAPGEDRSAADMAAALDRIDGLARRIDGVCGALLAYSRTAALDADRLRPADLEPIVAAAIERVEDAAEGRGVAIDPPTDSAVVRGDAELLEEVVVNLLTNAVEHARSGDRIGIDVSSGSGGCRVSVVDHGDGVPAAVLPTLFERYRSGKAHGGHGIGLALSRRIARSHGGDLVHEATPGGGATFRLLLPASPTGPAGTAAKRA